MPPEADLLARFSEVEVHWPKSYRIVPSRFQPIDLFEGIAGQAGDLVALSELEGLTSNRLREAAGEIHLVPEQDRRFGPGYTPIMAAFTYPAESRFSDGAYGVYHCARGEHTAVAETKPVTTASVSSVNHRNPRSTWKCGFIWQSCGRRCSTSAPPLALPTLTPTIGGLRSILDFRPDRQVVTDSSIPV